MKQILYRCAKSYGSTPLGRYKVSSVVRSFATSSQSEIPSTTQHPDLPQSIKHAELILFHDLRPLMARCPGGLEGRSPRIARLPLIPTLELLGLRDYVRERSPHTVDFVSLPEVYEISNGNQPNNNKNIVAIDVASASHAGSPLAYDADDICRLLASDSIAREAAQTAFAPDYSFVEPRTIITCPPDEHCASDIQLFSRARSYLCWHRQSRYCGMDGSPTSIVDGGSCRVSDTGITLYPRTDPVAIVAVEHPDQDHILLARGPGYPKRFISCLAGFVEPGETLEQAVQREIAEEVGLQTENVRYFTSQSWPIPRGAAYGQLMLANFAKASTTEMSFQDKEIEYAQWFNRDEIDRMLRKSTGEKNVNSEWNIPGPYAVAHHLLQAWVDRRNN